MKYTATTTVLALCVVGASASGDPFSDAIGDIATGNSNLDMVGLDITDNGVDLIIRLELADLDGDWGKYLFFADFIDGGSGDNDNPWGRDISGLQGMDFFMGSWINGGGGADVQQHVSGSWTTDGVSGSVWVDWNQDVVQWNVYNLVADLSAQGIYSLDFEVATTGGNWGDPAIDLFGDEGTQPGWGGGSHSIDRQTYTFTTIPAPGAIMLLGLAGLASRRRRR